MHTIPHLDVGSGRHHGALSVFPVWLDAPVPGDLDWSGDTLTIGELTGGPEVAALEASNRGAKPVVLLEGDLIEGGMQHRMVAASRVVRPGEVVRLDVFCVEARRWSGDGEHIAAGRRATSSVRRGAREGQSEVWARVGRHGSDPTGSLPALLERRSDLAELFRPQLGQRGVIVGVGGRILFAELFGDPSALAARWNGLLEAAALDAAAAPVRRTLGGAARDFAVLIGGMRLDRTGDALHGHRRGVAASGFAPDAFAHALFLDETHPVLG